MASTVKIGIRQSKKGVKRVNNRKIVRGLDRARVRKLAKVLQSIFSRDGRVDAEEQAFDFRTQRIASIDGDDTVAEAFALVEDRVNFLLDLRT